MRTRSETPSETRKLSLNESSLKKLGALKEKTEATSDSEVVRQALLYYEQLVDDVDQQRDVFLRQPDDVDGERDIHVSVHSSNDAAVEQDVSRTSGVAIKRNLVLPLASAARLDQLRQKSGARSDSEVVREAINVYDKIVTNLVRGHVIVVRESNGREHYKTIPLPRPRAPNPLVHRLRKAFEAIPG